MEHEVTNADAKGSGGGRGRGDGGRRRGLLESGNGVEDSGPG